MKADPTEKPTEPTNPSPNESDDPHKPDSPKGPSVPVDHRTGEAKAQTNAAKDPPA